jgi:AsmA-like C-terminal region
MSKKSSKRRTLKFSDILHIVRTAGASIKHFFSGLSSAPFAKRYYIATPFLIIFFILITFPAEIIVTNELKKMEGSLFKSIKTDELQIAPFRDWTAQSIIITTMQKSEITISDFDASLGTISLLLKKISGTIEASKFSFKTDTVEMTCSPAIKSDLSLDATGIPSQGTISVDLAGIMLNGLTLTSPMGPVTMKPISINTVKSSFTCSNKVMTIKECVITGKDMNGNIKGSATLDRNFSRSQLNFTIEIDSNSSMLSDFKPFLSSYINQSTGRLTLTVQGSAGSPAINMVNQNQNASPVTPSFKR